MAFTKLQLDGLTKPLVDLYTQLEQELLTNIAKRLQTNTDIDKKSVEAWKLQQMQALGLLDKENLKTIKSYTNYTSAQINQILYDAGIDGLEQTDEAMAKATKKGAHLKVPEAFANSPQLISILKAYQMQAHNTFNLTNMTLLKQSHSIYTNIVNKTTLDVLSGTKTHDAALRDTIKQWAEYGVPALVDKGGKKWGTEGYVRMVINTTAHNAAHAIQDQRILDYGIELVEVSSHSGARPKCAPYQGRIYSIKGTTPKYKNLYTDTSYGDPAGLFGINCHHTKYPYIEGINTQTYFPQPKEENDKAYKESQVQRAHERGIRQAKTQYEMHKANGDDTGMQQAKALISKRQGNLRDFIDETGRTRVRSREQIVKVNDIPKKPLPKDNPVTEPNIKQSAVTNNTPVQQKQKVTKVKEPAAQTPKVKPEKQVKEPTTNLGPKKPDSYASIDSNHMDLLRDAQNIANMPRENSSIIKKYTSNYYSVMNNYLRRNEDDMDIQEEVELLHNTIKQYAKPLSQNTMFHRNMSSDAIPHIFDAEIAKGIEKALYDDATNAEMAATKEKLIGGAITDKGFVSSTYVKGSFGGGRDVSVDIYAPKGYKGGMFVESVSEFRSEKEYLFNSNAHFNIFDVVIEAGKILFKVTPK